MEARPVSVTKEDGTREPFSHEKVLIALRRVGLSKRKTDKLLKKLESRLYDGIRTRRIYNILYKLIEKEKPEVSHRYNLKNALMKIGPEGYEFEDFISELLLKQGYRTEVRQILQGKCVSHEVDVVASKGRKTYLVECKFRNTAGTRCRTKDVLYTYARFLDLKKGAKTGKSIRFSAPWIVSNTKFSHDAKKYARCMKIRLLGWHYPIDNGLEVMIDRTKCYPVSVIHMSPGLLRKLLAHKIVTVFDIPESADRLMHAAGIGRKQAEEIIEKAEYAKK